MVTYLKGDATYPDTDGPKIIAHVCNDIGAWGRGFVLSLSKRWSAPENAYREAFKGSKLPQGHVQFIPVEGDVLVANMVAMRGIFNSINNPIPLQYDSLELALDKVYKRASEEGATVHMPKIGASLARGDWNIIKEIIEVKAKEYKIETYVYSF